jgi:hypothetical protein
MKSPAISQAIDVFHPDSWPCKLIRSNQDLVEVVSVQGHRQFRPVEKDTEAIAVATDAHDDALFLGNARAAGSTECA